TVLDLTVQPPHVLRPGMIHAESLEAVIGELRSAEPGERDVARLRSPGLLPRHYAPKARLIVLSWRDDGDLRRQLSALPGPSSAVHIIAHTRIPSGEPVGGVSAMPREAKAFARALYAELHRCDESGAWRIVVEALP